MLPQAAAAFHWAAGLLSACLRRIVCAYALRAGWSNDYAKRHRLVFRGQILIITAAAFHLAAGLLSACLRRIVCLCIAGWVVERLR